MTRKEYNKQYREKNAEKLKAAARARYLRDCEAIKASRRDHYERVGKAQRSSPEMREHLRKQARRYRAEGKDTSHGVTLAQKLQAMELQAGLCQICIVPMTMKPGLVNSAHVDHDHKTGAFRGMLCHSCNTGVGLLREDPLLLEGAVSYLRKCA